VPTEGRMTEEPICDFCSQPKPSVPFHCPDFTMDKTPGLPEYRSRGDWMACSTCGHMIREGKWEQLVARATAALAPKYGHLLPERILREQVRRSHDLFRQHWREGGEPRR
jgi:hypothetical protein